MSPEGGVRLGELFGNGPSLWLRIQVAHDEWHAARKVDVSDIRTLSQAET